MLSLGTFLILFASSLLALVSGHGYMNVPRPRQFFSREGLPSYPSPNQLWCGESADPDFRGVWQGPEFENCGTCGEAAGSNKFSRGGDYDIGWRPTVYFAGQEITVSVWLSYAHLGYFDVELCPNETETEGCFQKLEVVLAPTTVRNGTRVCVPYDGSPYQMDVTFKLPDGVTCNPGTLRWNYRIGTERYYAHGTDPCFDPNPTQAFRNCADVVIVPNP